MHAGVKKEKKNHLFFIFSLHSQASEENNEKANRKRSVEAGRDRERGREGEFFVPSFIHLFIVFVCVDLCGRDEEEEE